MMAGLSAAAQDPDNPFGLLTTDDAPSYPVFHEGIVAEDTVLCTPDFRLNDGIYVEWEYIARNLPMPNNRVLTKLNPNREDFVKRVMKYEDAVFVLDDYGFEWMYRKTLAGYCVDGNLKVKTIHDEYVDVDTLASLVVLHGNYGVDAFLDFNTGKQYTFLSRFLKNNDTDLYKEYSKTKKPSDEDFVRRYNEAHPLYLPVYRGGNFVRDSAYCYYDSICHEDKFRKIQERNESILTRTGHQYEKYNDSITVHSGVRPIDSVEYKPHFQFNDGVYFCLDDFRKNLPVLSADEKRKLTENMGFWKKLGGQMELTDDFGEKIRFHPLGECVNGQPKLQGFYYLKIGSLCTYVKIIKPTDSTEERYNCMFEFRKNGLDTVVCNYHNLQKFFKTADPQLHVEFVQRYKEFMEERRFLKNRQKLYNEFIDKYNKRHPLMVPVYE